ncbi:MmcQ/YjbR family DNA-binding protein [Streptomyces sp. MK7]|uniref:MmcQ/YjbR family DNA-binding protein n=1 Tax=Streptomyces sp. MK7 TaxID=3067635 RepID=UPI00292E374A|nr:MmcQ/YjbR family DNA-binding protein [Streptomyces sp. MK7]
MDGQELQKIAGEYAVGLPGTDPEHRFGPDWDLYKVRGKVFMLMTDVPGPHRDPQSRSGRRRSAAREVRRHTPGCHMDKRHWITLEGGGTIDEKLVEELVIDSYRLVVAGVPRPDRPVDPHTYGRRA